MNATRYPQHSVFRKLPLHGSSGLSFGDVHSAVGRITLLMDVDGVLYDDSCWKRWMFQLVGRFRPASTFEQFSELWETHFVLPTSCGRHSCREALRRCLSELGLTAGQLDEACAAGMARQHRLHDDPQPLPGVRRTLARLNQAGIKSAAWGHCPCGTEQLNRRLSRMHLDELIDDSFCVREFSETPLKYQNRFRSIRQRLGTNSDQTFVFVSIRPAELAAARDSGWMAIGSNLEQSDLPCIRQFEDILELLVEPVHGTTRAAA